MAVALAGPYAHNVHLAADRYSGVGSSLKLGEHKRGLLW